jgi:hypothetical protein
MIGGVSMRPRAAILLCSVLLSSCSVKADFHNAIIAAAHFHSLLNAGKFDQIAAEAGPELKWPKRGPRFVDYLGAIHRKLGFCSSSRMLSFKETFGKDDLARLSLRTHCENDDAEETFVFSGRGPAMKIRTYQITSPMLIAS